MNKYYFHRIGVCINKMDSRDTGRQKGRLTTGNRNAWICKYERRVRVYGEQNRQSALRNYNSSAIIFVAAELRLQSCNSTSFPRALVVATGNNNKASTLKSIGEQRASVGLHLLPLLRFVVVVVAVRRGRRRAAD